MVGLGMNGINTLMIVLSWLFLQAAGESTDIVQQIIEYSVSLGILILVLVTLYREWKSGIKYNRDTQQDLRELTERAITAIEKNTARMADLVEEIRRERGE